MNNDLQLKVIISVLALFIIHLMVCYAHAIS